MNKICFRFFIGVVLIFLQISTAYAQDEFDLIESKIVAYLRNEADTTQNSTIKANGSWADIDYSSTAETNWAPLKHLFRVKQFALQETTPAARTANALRFWLQANPTSKNWFQNDIASPTGIGEILMLLKGKKIIPISLRDSLIDRMKQGNVERAIGANKLDIAIHMIYRACVTRDTSLMKMAVGYAFKPVSLGHREGLQPDNSYRQHGPQLQIASYGQVFLIGEYKVASWLIGTSYAMPIEKLKILDNYLINTYLKTIRGRYIDFNTEGRGIARNDVLDKFSIISELLEYAKKVSPGNISELTAAEQRIRQLQPPSYKIEPAHAYFYKSDYTLHNRSAYSFNVRTVSKRTVRTESGNRENLMGKFLPDGSTNIQRTGAEYFNIMPIWEWDKIPGITSRDYAVDQKSSLEWGERGVGSFIGGVSDGLYGATAYELNYNEVTAKKAWFFFDNEVVCLGTDINSFAKEPIVTTVNQTWQKGKVSALADNQLFDANRGFQAKQVQWLWHDSIGYYFPKQGQLSLTNAVQSGSWATINANRSTAEVKGKVFKLWFNHGIDPSNQSYAYVVMPGISEADMINKKALPIEIIANGSKIQAVLHKDLKMMQVVFYEAGTVSFLGNRITVDQPCILMMKDFMSKKPTVSVADPTQLLSAIHVTFNDASTSLSFPQGEHKGATTSFQFN
ncbi:MAG: chondroitinase [Pedobacter sp.]|nr:MAG: chondroitinase [Pedobacter sp.]